MAEMEVETDKLVENTNLEHMLEFETQVFLDIIHKDGLVVAAKGLNMDLVILNLLKVYCDPGNLVIVLNSNDKEEKFFTNKLQSKDVHTTTFSTNQSDREEIYKSGGIHFVSTRILVVDMLKKRIPIDKITGCVILRAHRVVESCQEAFILRLFRQSNKTGFVKAFSNNVQSFTMGFGHVERVMRALFVKELFIWPRFHKSVIQDLKKYEPQTVEIHIPISTNMSRIQTLILEVMNLTVKQLKQINKTVELQEITVENCLSKKFQKILQSQLDLIWNQLSQDSCRLVAELKILRHLIITLLYCDPITFYTQLLQYRTIEYAKATNWVLLEPAEKLFNQAKSLVFGEDNELNPEFCPKWNTLLEVLKVEIPNDIQKTPTIKDGKILILCSDNRTCFQLKELLSHGPCYYLFYMALKNNLKFKRVNEIFKNCDTSNIGMKQNVIKSMKVNTNAGKEQKKSSEEEDWEDFKNSYVLTMSQISRDCISEQKSEYIFEPFEEMENMNLTQVCENTAAPTILIQTFKGLDTCTNLQRSLDNLKPNFIIMYHVDMSAIREIEMYEAHRQSDELLKVFILLHAETVEEQSYLTSLKREKEAFEFLIQTKSTMVVPEDQDGKTNICQSLQADISESEKNTRQGGKTDDNRMKKTIIVDMREFRSELPCLLHKRGIHIQPFTITVGDYILTPEICVERKSVSDLIGSLNHGRLYQQCTQMSRHYQKPMLLIEFDQNKPFSWQNNFIISNDIKTFDIQQKLLLLTLHFPKLKIIWSPSPYASAQLFEELKVGKDEPIVEYAVAVGTEQDYDTIISKYNSSVYDFVQRLPGITSKNISVFLRKFNNFSEIIEKSEEELVDVLRNSVDAKAFYEAMHNNHNNQENMKKAKNMKGKSKLKTSVK